MRPSDRGISTGSPISQQLLSRHETDPVFLASDTFLVGGDLDHHRFASGPRVDRRIILLMLPRSRAGYFGIGFRHRET